MSRPQTTCGGDPGETSGRKLLLNGCTNNKPYNNTKGYNNTERGTKGI